MFRKADQTEFDGLQALATEIQKLVAAADTETDENARTLRLREAREQYEKLVESMTIYVLWLRDKFVPFVEVLDEQPAKWLN